MACTLINVCPSQSAGNAERFDVVTTPTEEGHHSPAHTVYIDKEDD